MKRGLNQNSGEVEHQVQVVKSSGKGGGSQLLEDMKVSKAPGGARPVLGEILRYW